MLFKDIEHNEFYYTNIKLTSSENDIYRKSLFYILGLTRETRNHIEDIYNFRENGINFDGLNKAWQTSTSMDVTRLAFNLYNGFCGRLEGEEIDDSEKYSPYYLFDNELLPFFLEAIKIRYFGFYNLIA